MNPKPAPTNPAATNTPNIDSRTLEIAGAGLLALLIVGGAIAAVMSRRRKRREQEWADAQTMAFEPFETSVAAAPELRDEPAAAAPAASAFAWGQPAPAATGAESKGDQDDRRPGETWVERAYRGPSPNNPSVSLRNRLKRAAFFDKREREAAAGLAEPVDANAGLPGAMAGERELA
jgi:hypothetical protein